MAQFNNLTESNIFKAREIVGQYSVEQDSITEFTVISDTACYNLQIAENASIACNCLGAKFGKSCKHGGLVALYFAPDLAPNAPAREVIKRFQQETSFLSR